MNKKYIGIDELGDKYEVCNVNFEEMTAQCELDEWMGWQKCSFEKFVEVSATPNLK